MYIYRYMYRERGKEEVVACGSISRQGGVDDENG